MSMKTFFHGLCGAAVVVAFGAASVLAGEGENVPEAPAPFAHSPVAAPQASVESAKTDVPVEVPGLPPLPPLPNGEASGPAHGASQEADCRPGGGLFVDAEYLYLKPYRRDAGFAIVSVNPNGDPEGSIQSDSWRSRSAFRLGAGYRLPDDGWDVGFAYTYLHDEQTGFLTRPARGRLFATLTHPGTVELVDRASADATLSYNVFDLEIGRRMDAGEHLSIRPFAGLRFAEINQNLAVLYDGGDANRDMVGSRVKFDGGGLRAGGEADLKLLDHVSVYGRAAASLLTGDFRVTQTEFNNAGATPLTNVGESFRKVTPVMEMGAGVSYRGEHLRMSVGYEITNWFNLIDAPVFVDDVHQGKFLNNVSDLSVGGFAARVEFNY
jgi:Legionella pneumophila major outer membrane protein precursor